MIRTNPQRPAVPPPPGVEPRACGHTVVCGGVECGYRRGLLNAADWKQISELVAQGRGPIQVLAWAAGETIYDSTKARRQ